MKRLPIAKTELREIIEGNFCYVDKTRYIKEMVDDGHKYYFLARPRRFGKSLFVDTLRAAFAGEKELFKSLYLEQNWNWDEKFPIIQISFGSGTVENRGELNASFDFILRINAAQFGLELRESFLPNRFNELIINLYNKFNSQIVVLIDEYDKPILDNLTKPEAEEIRDGLSSIYSVLKDASRYLKFVFLTGVSKFSKTSIFSKLNNLTDISFVEKYADICGYTQTDLEAIFNNHLRDVDLNKVKQWYDGYNFLGSNLYNPYDVLMYLWDKRFQSYWFETGTPAFLLELIKQRNFFVPSLEEVNITASQLAEFDVNNIQLDVLLFQTGYLTIKQQHEIAGRITYTLKIPNLEVKIGFTDYLLNMFYASMLNSNERSGLSEKIYLSITNKQPEQLHQAFVSIIA